MGNDVSKQDNVDLEQLKFRFSCFSKTELKLLCESYRKLQGQRQQQQQQQQQQAPEQSPVHNDDDETSDDTTDPFFFRWLRHGTVPSSNEQADDEESQKRQAHVFRHVQENILPMHFREQLNRASANNQSSSNDSNNKNNNKNASSKQKDTTSGSLEYLLDFLANASGRRGTRAALATLFQCAAPADQYGTSCTDLVDTSGREIKAKVSDVIDLAYRLAVAAEYLFCARPKEQRQLLLGSFSSSSSLVSFTQEDDAPLLVLPAHESETALPLAIRALTDSCIDFVHQSRLKRSTAGVEFDDSDLDAGYCSKMDFLEWSAQTTPLLATVLPSFLQTVWRGAEHEGLPMRFSFPRLKGSSLFFDNDQRRSLFAMACMSKNLGGSWHPLYTSENDGLSYDSLLNALLGYGGPTLMIMHAQGATFGSFTASPWKASKDYYGDPDCFLFQLSPQTSVYPPGGNERNYMFCNDQKRKSPQSKLPCGIGFGGDANRGPRLFLDETLSICYATCRDRTYRSGPILPRTDSFSEKIYFSIDHLEVWGCCCGDDEEEAAAQALLARQRERSLRASNIQNARRVDKAAFLGDLRTGLIESKAFTHMDQIHGSTRIQVLNRNSNSYEYEA